MFRNSLDGQVPGSGRPPIPRHVGGFIPGQPTFEDLSIDDTLSEIERIVKYARSSIGLQRLVHVKMLSHVAVSVGFADTMTLIMPLLDDLSFDSEPAVKQHLVEQLSLLGKFCAESGAEGYKAVVEQILPVTSRLLEDEKPEVRQAAVTTLVELAQLIKADDLGQHVLTIILRLAHEDEKEEMRMTASELLNLLTEVLGHDLCKQFVIPEVVSLAEDPVFRVRKATALNFHNVCKIGGEHELFERLMPAFVRLSKDDMYRVRRACAESLSDISKHVSDDIRIGVLIEIFLRLTQDPSKLVKQSILQQSGLFIATLPPRAVTDVVLAQFCSMASGPTGDMQVDAELKHYCAYSLPAVLKTIGAGRWKEIREVYQSLVQCRSQNVRQTLATSLHEIAKLLGGGKLVEIELVPVFEEMIQDVEAVQMGVIKYLAEFLKMLSEPCRVSYLPLLHDILHSTNPFNWRLRQSLSAQLSELLLLPPSQSVYMTLFPLVMTLLQDPVAHVRRDCFRGVARMVALLHTQALEDEGAGSGQGRAHFSAVARAINSLARGEAFHTRQLWAELAHHLLRDLTRPVFEAHFVDGLLALASDPVYNVRVAVAAVLGGWAPLPAPWEAETPWTYLLARPDIREVVRRLSHDDKDVCDFVTRLQPAFPELSFAAVSCRGRKDAPGGSEPIVNCQTGRAGGEALPSILSDGESGHDSIDLVAAASPSPTKHIKLSSPSSSSSSTPSSSSAAAVASAAEATAGEEEGEGVFAFGGGVGISRATSGSPPLDESPVLAALSAPASSDEDKEPNALADNVLPAPDFPINLGSTPQGEAVEALTRRLSRELALGD